MNGRSVSDTPPTDATGTSSIDPHSRLRQPILDDDFAGTERFERIRRLGAGGMGVVYEVLDRVRGDVVALKTLRRVSAADLYRLKREFRALADVAHPNLVCLYELHVDAAHSFITMELVEGVNFVEYVRSGGAFSRPRLVGALAQLVDGLAALHRAGKLHRDIKPSNMLVTAEGRVVILDFGLTSEVTSPSREWEGTLLGTPAYMAPELRTNRSATDASDWYAVGATLYQALTGRVPFAASAVDGVLDKAGQDPPAPVEISSGVPEELSAICMAMLCRDPAHRLSGQEALARLGLTARASPQPARPHRGAFVGRTAELRGLRLALDAAGDGHRAAVCIHGVSGIGKSALIRRFLDDVTATSSVLVLAGRCYEHESVPYKALDTVIDSLSRYLASLPTGGRRSASAAGRAVALTAVPGDVARGRGGQRMPGRRVRVELIRSACDCWARWRCGTCWPISPRSAGSRSGLTTCTGPMPTA